MRFPSDMVENQDQQVIQDLLTVADATKVYLLAGRIDPNTGQADPNGYAVTLQSIKNIVAGWKFAVSPQDTDFEAVPDRIYLVSNAVTVTLPEASTQTNGNELVLVNVGADIAEVVTSGSDVFNGQPGEDSHQMYPGDSVRLLVSGGMWIIW